ncbi:hypothetical protein REPUB_Repub04eG0230200 [Reevesia pubescens]
MGYIGQHGVAALHRYKYSGVDHSYLAKYVLQPFWGRVVNFFPLWMPLHLQDLCSWLHLHCLAMFIPHAWIHLHQDGFILCMGYFYFYIRLLMLLMGSKRDEQTPLVHLENFLTMFETLAFGSTAMCGRDTFWFWVISAVPFYGATWEHYFTNTLILPVVNGPTEGLALIYTMHFVTAFLGGQWWAQQFGKSFPFFSWVPFVNEIPTYRAVLYLMIAFAVIPTVYCNIRNVHKVVHARKGSMLLALAMLYPFAVLMGGVLVWDYLSPSDIIGNYPHLVVLGTGLAFGFLVGRMILAHLCDEPKGLKTNMCMSLLYLPLAIANALTARLNDGVPLVDELWVLLGYCIFTASLYLHFATSVIQEITTALGIYCFRITRKEA